MRRDGRMSVARSVTFLVASCPLAGRLDDFPGLGQGERGLHAVLQLTSHISTGYHFRGPEHRN